MRDPKRKLSDSERRAIVLEVDDILGLNHDPAEPPPARPDEPAERRGEPPTEGGFPI